MKKRKLTYKRFTGMLLVLSFMTAMTACQNGSQSDKKTGADSTKTDPEDTATVFVSPDTTKDSVGNKPAKVELSIVKIYNFHVTNRCASCIAIEDATTKTLNTYFSAEMKSGRIKRKILNVDDEANSAIAEKYQAFGSGVFVTRVFKGKESTTDLTGDGFKYAKNKEEKYIEILKNTISNYLR